MAGEIAAAATGIQAPPVGGSVSGDIASAISGILKGQQEEEERRRKIALENAMYALQERQVGVMERNAGANERQAGAAETQARAQQEFANIQRDRLDDERDAAKRARERKDMEAASYRAYMYSNGWEPEGSLDDASSDAVIEIYGNRVRDRAAARASASMRETARINAFAQSITPMMAQAQQRFALADAGYKDLYAKGEAALAASNVPGMTEVPAKYLDERLDGTPEGEAMTPTYMFKVPPDVQRMFFQEQIGMLDQMAAQAGAPSYSSQVSEAWATRQAAMENLKQLDALSQSMWMSGTLAGYNARQDAGMSLSNMESLGGQNVVGPVVRATPGTIETNGGTLGLPGWGAQFQLDGESMTRLKWLAKNQPAAALTAMNGLLRQHPDLPELVQQLDQVLSEVGLDPTSLQEMATAHENAMGLRYRNWTLSTSVDVPIGVASHESVSPTDEAGRSLRAAKTQADSLISHAREMATDVSTGSSADVRATIRQRIEHNDWNGVVDYAREQLMSLNQTLDTIGAIYGRNSPSTKNYQSVLRDRWPARIPR